MFRSIKTKILVLEIGLILSMTASLGVISYKLTYSALRDSQKQNLKYVSEHISEQINILINHKKDLLEKIGHSEPVINYAKKQQENFLIGYFERYTPEFSSLSYVNSKGMEELKTINGRMTTDFSDVSNSEIFRSASGNPSTVYSSYVAFCPEINGPCIEFGFCETDFFDEFIGFILGRVSVTELIKDVHNFEQNDAILSVLVDSDGTVLAYSDKSKVLKKLMLGGGESKRISSEITAAKDGSGRAIISGTDSYIAYTPVNGQKWSVITILPYKVFMAQLTVLQNTVVLVSLTILILGITLSLFVASNITGPVMELVKGTDLLAAGDFSQRVDVDSKDEIGTLAKAFNGMAENLEKTTTSVIKLNREIVERQKAEDMQQDLNRELEETVRNVSIANRELTDFAHIAAHDLKAPLRAIGSLAGILLADYGDKMDERGRQYLDTLTRRTERMSELIGGIMTYSELGKQAVFQPVDINEAVQQVITGITVPDNVEITQENDFPTLLCDRTHIIQIFQNLISNAIKFMDKPQGYIKLGCVEENDSWKFSVKDNGCGIEEKYFDRIFKIFQTLIRRDEQESTGIGLSVVKRIIEKYNGKIWVESQPGTGSTFFFTLPREPMEVNNEKYQTNTVN